MKNAEFNRQWADREVLIQAGLEDARIPAILDRMNPLMWGVSSTPDNQGWQTSMTVCERDRKHLVAIVLAIVNELD